MVTKGFSQLWGDLDSGLCFCGLSTRPRTCGLGAGLHISFANSSPYTNFQVLEYLWLCPGTSSVSKLLSGVSHPRV